jgi:hypothetical protein
VSETLNPQDQAIPTIGRIVIYRSKTGDYVMPAIVSATLDTLHQPNVDAGHMHPLSGPLNVHLTVFTAGYQGQVSQSTMENHPELADPARRNYPAGGTFQEWDIPYSDTDEPGCWSWPVRG